MPTCDLIGRRQELATLTRWLRGEDTRTRETRIFTLLAIGGMGKSALTWKWFNDHAPAAMPQLAGRFWWSFYEHDATFERFVTEALAYTTGRHPSALANLSRLGQEQELLAVLDQRPFLFVLDGLERLLVAYARIDAARLQDDDLDRQTGHVLQDPSDPWTTLRKPSNRGEHLRRTQDPRAGDYLIQLTKVRAARFLITSRLLPAAIQDRYDRYSLPGSTVYFLQGLRGADSLELWRALSGGGEAPEVLALLDHVQHHPLVVRALAGEVACYRRAPGNFAIWQADHPQFEPGKLPLVQARSHILAFAFKGLEFIQTRVARIIAALRMPATYEALAAILVGPEKTCSEERVLVAALDELESRGISGWDRVKNEYDMHPLVRAVLLENARESDRKEIDEDLRRYFESIEPVLQYQVNEAGLLTPAIELCHSLARLGRLDEAYKVFRLRIGDAMMDFLSGHIGIEILMLFFPNGMDRDPPLAQPLDRLETRFKLATSLEAIGQIRAASRVFSRLAEQPVIKGWIEPAEIRCSLANLQIHLGLFKEAETTLSSLEEGSRSSILGRLHLERGDMPRAAEYCGAVGEFDFLLIDHALRMGRPRAARAMAESALEMHSALSYYEKSRRAELHFLRLYACALMEMGELPEARARLEGVVAGGREINDVELETRGLISLADLHQRLGSLEQARECLEDVWEPVERGPYRLLHADARNVEAAIEMHAGNGLAGQAAVRAFELAWCDGPPYAYHWGLIRAESQLRLLDLPIPAPATSAVDAE